MNPALYRSMALDLAQGARQIAAAGGGLLDFVPRVSPNFVRPKHLVKLVDLFERAMAGEAVRAVFAGPPQHGKPLGKGTRVTMADGSQRPISALCVGDRVVSGEGRPTTVTAVFDQGRLPVYRVVTRSGRSFLAEGSHRFLTQRGWLRVDELRAYDRAGWRRPRGDTLLAAAEYATESTPIDVEVARFLGYMVGDGNSTQGNCRWTNADPDVRASFIRTVVALGGNVSEHDEQTLGVLSGEGAGGHVKRTPEETRAWMARYERARRADPSHREPRASYPKHHLKALLAERGVDGKKAAEKVVPDAVFAGQIEAVRAFLGAYFECDGTRGVEPGERGACASFSSVSKVLLEGCRALLARLGIRSSLLAKRGRYKGAPHLSWILTIQDQARFFDVVPIVGAKAGAKASSRRLERAGRLRDGVVEVTPAGEEECFCITVADDESFLAEDLITHNTEVELHAIAWILRRDPSLPLVYGTYSAELAEDKSDRARGLARIAGVEISGSSDAKNGWLTTAGGGLRARGVGGGLTGNPAAIAIVDDPYKNRADAESSAYRRMVEQWFDDVLMSRLAPGGSVIVTATRWTPNDLSGKLVKDGWEYIRLPAIEDVSLEAYEAIERALRVEVNPGRAEELRAELARAEAALRLLWPERWEGRRRELLARRVNAYTWASLYQGSPRPRGGTVFKDVYRYDPKELPGYAYREAMGLDAAYTRTTSSDSSAYNVQRRFGDKVYVVDAFSGKLSVPDLMRRVGGIQQTRGGIPCRWYTSTTESGVADLAAGYGAIVEAVRASQDKFLRAQPMAGAWNEGRVLVPSSGEPWVDVFLNSMLDFTGIGDEADDPVDAAVAAYDVLVPEQVIQPVKLQVAPASPIVADRRWAESGGRGW